MGVRCAGLEDLVIALGCRAPASADAIGGSASFGDPSREACEDLVRRTVLVLSAGAC